jgi:Zn-dependent protease
VVRSGSFRIGQAGGVTVGLHWSFALVLGWGAWQGWAASGSIAGAAYGILAISLLFGAVLLHEMGHALTARGFGLTVRQVTLLPIGGMAELETTPSQPIQELAIALAGPMVNLALTIGLAAASWLIEPYWLDGWQFNLMLLARPGPLALIHYLLWANGVLFFFNMLPAFPMDGGRVVRSALATWFDYEASTRVAAWLGRLMAIIITLAGLAGWVIRGFTPTPLFVIVGIVVYFGAWQEERSVRRRRALVHLEARDISREASVIVAPAQPLTRSLVVRLMRDDLTVPVVREDGLLAGLLTYQDVQRVSRQGVPPTVAHAMRTDFPVIGPHDTLWVALREMTLHHLDSLPVLQQGRMVGLVTLDDIDRAWKTNSRRHRERRPRSQEM